MADSSPNVGFEIKATGWRRILRAFTMAQGRGTDEFDRIVQRHGERIYDEARRNLAGGVLRIRTGRLRSRWMKRRPEPMVFEAANDVFYGYFHEKGYTQRAGFFPLRQGGEYSGTTTWRYTKGGYRRNEWLGPVVRAREPEFVRDMNRSTWRILRGGG